MDIAYFRNRLDTARRMAATADNEFARRAHSELANLYASRVAAAEAADSASDPDRAPPARASA